MLIATEPIPVWPIYASAVAPIMLFNVAMLLIHILVWRVQLALKNTKRLEQEVGVATQLIQLLAGELQVVGGVDGLGPELTRVLAACDENQLRAIIQRIDYLTKTKQRTNAVRQYRDLLACTWDEAFEAIDEWASLSHDQKLTRIYLKKARQALKQPIVLPSLQPA